jgi:hypothetical protein
MLYFVNYVGGFPHIQFSITNLLSLRLLLLTLVFAANAALAQQTQIQYLSGRDKDNTVLWDFMLTGATGSLLNVPIQPLRGGTQTICVARQYQSSFPSLNEKMAEVWPEKVGII